MTVGATSVSQAVLWKGKVLRSLLSAPGNSSSASGTKLILIERWLHSGVGIAGTSQQDYWDMDVT